MRKHLGLWLGLKTIILINIQRGYEPLQKYQTKSLHIFAICVTTQKSGLNVLCPQMISHSGRISGINDTFFTNRNWNHFYFQRKIILLRTHTSLLITGRTKSTFNTTKQQPEAPLHKYFIVMYSNFSVLRTNWVITFSDNDEPFM